MKKRENDYFLSGVLCNMLEKEKLQKIIVRKRIINFNKITGANSCKMMYAQNLTKSFVQSAQFVGAKIISVHKIFWCLSLIAQILLTNLKLYYILSNVKTRQSY